MTNFLSKPLGFSETFLRAEYIENAVNYRLVSQTVVINAHNKQIVIEGKSLKPWNSSIYSSLVIPKAPKIICITLDTDLFLSGSYPHADVLTRKWSRVDKLFPVPHLKDTQLWRSEKDRIGPVEFNFWFAAAGTNCGIHNEHNFKEFHTQVFGIGRMQKFHKNDRNSIYQEVFMSPGYTHEPFYNEDCTYPWHQYWADTDCIWLAIEFYGG
ncbi:MAG TPA: hypothetical protein VMW72_01890 [Sedimentisphaerales bacterium]|nr:hypothetical protein [Sedimentisphaerales bacterium]